jgi:hypothetical protein
MRVGDEGERGTGLDRTAMMGALLDSAWYLGALDVVPGVRAVW